MKATSVEVITRYRPEAACLALYTGSVPRLIEGWNPPRELLLWPFLWVL
jgi:hypothetical protein